MYKLSDHPEHADHVADHVKRWTDIALSTTPMDDADRAIVTASIAQMCVMAQIPAPIRTVFAPGALSGAFAAGIAAGFWYLRATPAWHEACGTPTADEVHFAMRLAARQLARAAHGLPVVWSDAATRDAAADAATRSATRGATDAATRGATDAVTRDATRIATDDATRDATWAATWAATGAATAVATRAATDDATRDATWGATNTAADVVWAATDDATDDATNAATEAATYAATRAATGGVAAAAVNAATYAATRDATDAATDDATDDATWAATYVATSAATDGATDAATWAATEAATRTATAATRDATWDATWAATEAATDAATRDATVGATWAATAAAGAPRARVIMKLAQWFCQCAQRAWFMRDGGNQWPGFPCLAAYRRDVVGFQWDWSIWEPYEKCVIHGGPRWLPPQLNGAAPQFAMVADRPVELHRDDAGRLHRIGGPAKRWADGVALWYIAGVRVDARVSLGQFSAADVLAESNAEVRRVMIDVYGRDRWIRDVGARVLDMATDTMGRPMRLLRVDLTDDEPIVVLEVTNSTPEPVGEDGAADLWRGPWRGAERGFKRYMLRVDPELRPLPREGRPTGPGQAMTCENARASLAGKRGCDYAPGAES